MSDVVASGSLSTAFDALAALLSNVPAWQALTQTDNANDALARIFTHEIGSPIESIAIAGNVLTVTLRQPCALTVGQRIALDGAEIGEQAAVNVAGEYEIALIVDADAVPLENDHDIAWINPDSGEPWIQFQADCTRFTVLTSAADCEEIEPEFAVVLPGGRPFATIMEENDALTLVGVATGGCVIARGALSILIEARTSPGYRNDQRNSKIEATNVLSAIIDGLGILQGVDDYIALNEISIQAPPTWDDTASGRNNAARFDVWRALVRVTWGLNG